MISDDAKACAIAIAQVLKGYTTEAGLGALTIVLATTTKVCGIDWPTALKTIDSQGTWTLKELARLDKETVQ